MCLDLELGLGIQDTGTLGLGGSGLRFAGVGRLRWIGHKCSHILQYLLPWASMT